MYIQNNSTGKALILQTFTSGLLISESSPTGINGSIHSKVKCMQKVLYSGKMAFQSSFDPFFLIHV